MTYTELIKHIAGRTGVPEAKVGAILRATVDVALEALGEGDEVALYGLGTLSSAWRAPRTLRSIADQRRLRVDGRYLARFRPSKRLRDALAARTPQAWRDPRHQDAWRVAETLVGDLALYHGGRAPGDLGHGTALEAVDTACARQFGPIWAQARRTFDSRVPGEVRAHVDYLALAARNRWAARDSS